eukprot:CAMPEP_0116579768 /NCGR_PEP_ID=MMETSP0397-20121206/22426_1 /TAXON_ID=216820 /ORGANISM="Cyclophora tenuis, Strain ECT3854" /LENGTH=179 /DNA_ID=CAMNT_0004109267 /DNA_START=30 /DNA_END=565 /DNA_ORIENTATION=+
MQKVKDRKAKLEERKEHRIAEKERIEEAERQKQRAIQERLGVTETEEKDDETENQEEEEEEQTSTTTYRDAATQSQWGGRVVVTTTAAAILSSSSDEEEDDEGAEKRKRKKQSVDLEQKYAGNVEKFLRDLKGNMPGKRNRDRAGNRPKKGKHGAENMKGIGGASNLRLAQKALSKFQA